MAIVVMFSSAREAAGMRRDEVPGDTVDAVLSAAVARYGNRFGEVLGYSRVWLNGEAVRVDEQRTCSTGDELAILPPVAGG